ncbi:uncharacterized protein LOC131166676 [Malania oleifera]|uniref:uncharacterized protein LOC131166676 n=1 Tax=Malania oleifera TaxID=397392 RepID=UPI0025ADFC51|nr:uncharacterized protein LOC131166676 [Malania oleifera]
MHPPTFVGGPDPIIAEDWVKKTKRILEVLHCTNEQRVVYATFQLSGEAGRWWTTVNLLEKQRAGVSEMSWSHFKEVFFKRYFSASTRDAKADALFALSQGNIMVQGYVAWYIELSCFAPCLISKKATVIENGIRKDEVDQESKKRTIPFGS